MPAIPIDATVSYGTVRAAQTVGWLVGWLVCVVAVVAVSTRLLVAFVFDVNESNRIRPIPSLTHSLYAIGSLDSIRMRRILFNGRQHSTHFANLISLPRYHSHRTVGYDTIQTSVSSPTQIQ